MIKEYLQMAGIMMLMLICAVIGFAAWVGIGLFFYCCFVGG